ncbi:MAG: CPBP family intramembrane metalloprotease [Erysipelotrichaceae bacterium]|nr:CPBP family intramembrane metalloprotease [Erysipelotrichaceae bacterium]
MREYEQRLKRHMHFQFNLIGFAFLCLCAIGAAGHFFKDAIWVQYRDVIDIFAYGFIDNLYQIATKLIQSFVPFFLISLILKIKNHQIWSKAKIKPLNQFALIFLGLAVYLILSAATSGLITLATSKNVGVASVPSSLVSNFLEVQWTYLFYVILLCPLAEEYIYRGVVLQCFARYGNRFAIVASSFLFALSFGRLQTALPGFFLGMFLAVIALYYQSIRPVLWIRMGVAILSVAEMLIPLSQVWIFGIICLVSYGISLIFLFINRYNRLVLKSDTDEMLSAKMFCTSALLVLACGVMIALTYSLPLRQWIEQLISKVV